MLPFGDALGQLQVERRKVHPNLVVVFFQVAALEDASAQVRPAEGPDLPSGGRVAVRVIGLVVFRRLDDRLAVPDLRRPEQLAPVPATPQSIV